MAVDHYENFPVASWLCPAPIRPAIRAIYAFARTADDLADEGDAAQGERLEALSRYRDALHRAVAGEQASAWASVFQPLARAIRSHALPVPLLDSLLDAFEQDVRNPIYPDRGALLDYCSRSANPVGRLVLHLHGIQHKASLVRSDAICTSLQLINFWQDLSVDLPRGRVYVPLQDARRHGVTLEALSRLQDGAESRSLVRDLCDWSAGLMRAGAPLVHEIPGRAGFELRLVVQGGLRILARIAAMDHATLRHRPTLGPRDALPMAWQAWRMRARHGAAGLAA